MWVDRVPLAPGSLVSSPSPTYATLQGLPDGELGTAETLSVMRDVVRAAVRDPKQVVREAALQILNAAGVPQRKWVREIQALHAFVRDTIQYVTHPQGVQIVQEPAKTLEYGRGNCVDKSVLLASLLEALGHPSQFVALVIRGQQNGQFSHVIVETKNGPNWMPLETILSVPAGWYPPDAEKRYVRKI
jgi:transglutaminase-like putative cysteine protease